MARELTSTETQALSHIREQRADATRTVASALRARRQLETQLRETQHQMASPNGISSSEQLVEEVSRLRREIQAAATREQDADAIRNRLSAEETRLLSFSVGQITRLTESGRTEAVGDSPPIALHMKSGLDELRRAQAQHERKSAAREDLEKKLLGNIRKTMLVVFLSALCVAAIADLLSFFEIEMNLLVAWIIPMISWFLVRRVSDINKGGDAIVSAHTAAQRQLALLQQRLRPAMQSSGNTGLLVSARIDALTFAGKSYVATFARDTIITQLIELVPIINMLPFYMGQVMKVLLDQNLAYQKARKLMPHLHYAHQQIERLEQFEIEFMARQIATAIRGQQIIGSRRQQVPVTQSPTARASAPLALRYAPSS